MKNTTITLSRSRLDTQIEELLVAFSDELLSSRNEFEYSNFPMIFEKTKTKIYTLYQFDLIYYDEFLGLNFKADRIYKEGCF